MTKNTEVKNLKRVVVEMMSGSVLTKDFFVNNLPFIVTLFVIAILYISNGYTCTQQTAEIARLKNKLQDAKLEHQALEMQLTGMGRQSRVQKLVESRGLDLHLSDKPVYEVITPVPVEQ